MQRLDITPTETQHIVIPNIPPVKKPKTLIFIITLLIFLLLASSVAAFYFYKKSHSVVYYTPSTPATPSTSSAVMVTDTPKADRVFIDAAITWYPEPIKVNFPDVLNAETKVYAENKDNPAVAYEIGKRDNGSTIILLELLPAEMGGTELVGIMKMPDGKYVFFPATASYSNAVSQIFDLNKISQATESIATLEYVDSIIYKNQPYKPYLGFWSPQKAKERINKQKLVDTVNGPFYVEYIQHKENHALVKSFFLSNNTGYTFSFVPKYDFINEEQKITVKLNDGQTITEMYDNGFKGGCGSDNGSVIKPDSDYVKNIVKTGEIQNSNYSDKSIYRFSDINNTILDEIYQVYKNIPDFNSPTPKPKISKEEFNKVNSYFLWKDADGDWQIFINGQYALQAECGKPVIYLYPTQDTRVSVKVGANITQSEPLYPANGWTVLAHPNGQLEYKNKLYPNLFWEGLGFGSYPSVKNRGFVVAQKDLVSTIYNHLQKLGLNSQESADFIDFWQSKLPKSDYVRLTWLNTQEMDTLAPLNVSPKPDSVIRIFLDAAPTQKDDKLIPQVLTSIPRKGFTLIEWGGLLVK